MITSRFCIISLFYAY